MAPIFEDGNNKKDPPREDDLFDLSSRVHSIECTLNKGEMTDPELHTR